MKVNTAALNRISFLHSMAIENDKITGTQFSPLNPIPGALYAEAGCCVITGYPVRLVVGIPAERLKAELEQTSPPWRALLRPPSLGSAIHEPVEEFVHVYNLLLMVCENNFSKVEAFILSKDPAVPQTPDPRNANRRETVYTRLRHQLAHSRTRGNLDSTKAEMTEHLAGLIALTKQAIESQPVE